MPSPFIPSGGNLADFYTGAMAPPDRLNGTLVPSLNATTLTPAEIYQSIIGGSAPYRVTPEGLNVYSRPTVAIGPDGNPVVTPPPPTLTALMNSRDRFDDKPLPRPIRTGMLPYPPDSRAGGAPTQVALMNGRDRYDDKPLPNTDPTWQQRFTAVTGQPLVPAPQTGNFFDFLGGAFSNNNAPTTRVAQAPGPKDEARLPTGTGLAFVPDAQTSPALTAIDLLTGSGNSSFPRPMPMAFVPRGPFPPAQTPLTAMTDGLTPTGATLPGATNFDGLPVQIMAPPDVPMPRARPAPPMPNSYTIRPGDNLETLAKRFGTTVNQIANANGISNPDKIRAGATLNLGFMAPPVPRMPPAALGRGYGKPKETRAERFTNLDEFGMIR